MKFPSGEVFLSSQAAFAADGSAPQGQSADSSGLVRVVKDVLRVGKWKVGRDARSRKPVLFDFTAEILKFIADQFALAKSRGVEFNLCNTHGDPKTREVHPTDLISPIEALSFDGNTLWMSSLVTPEQAEYLKNPARKVSAKIVPDFVDGQGNRYPLQLVHVAVTDLPVVSGQGQFFVLSNSEEMSMDFAALVDAINQLLAKFGLGTLPDGVDETSIVVALQAIASATPNEEANEGEAAPAGEAQPGMEMSSANQPAISAEALEQIKSLTAKTVELSNKLAVMEGEKAKAKFDARLDSLCEGGFVSAAIRKTLEQTGGKLSWDLSLLNGLDQGEAAFPRARVSKSLATGEAPPVEGALKPLSEEDIQKGIRLLVPGLK